MHFDRLCAQYVRGMLDWADLLEITGLTPAELYTALADADITSPRLTEE